LNRSFLDVYSEQTLNNVFRWNEMEGKDWLQQQ
jgi:hypothetical protein